MASGGTGLVMDISGIVLNVENLPANFDRIIKDQMQVHGTRIVNAAKTGAPWKDQTSNARNGLFMKSGKEGQNYFIDVSHRVPYGIYLETRWGGRLATIMPSIQAGGPGLLADLSTLLT